jgi:hypothetical protein
MFKSAKLRLAGRALIAGVAAAVAYMQASQSYDKSAIAGAAVAGLLSFAEVFTPLNAYVGFFKGHQAEAQVLVADLLAKLGNPSASQTVGKSTVIDAVKEVAK